MNSASFHADGGVSLIPPSGIKSAERSNGKLLNRFYEPLHLLRMLNADRGPGEVDLPSSPQSRGFKMIWRRFLDDLAWLCDNRHGGETVSAVAAQDLPEGIRFWLVSKHEASFDHLGWVVTELKNAGERTDEEQRQGEELQEISQDALSRAREVELAPGSPETPAEYDSLLCESESLTLITGDPLALCRAAKQFSQRKMLATLLRSHSSIDTHSPWASLWHYIGRLACWFGKCENLVLTALQFPQLLENARCEFLALPTEIKLPVNKSKADLASALKRMLPADQQNMASTLYNQLADMRLFDIPVAFSENFTDETLKGRIHAEVFLMEHFYFNRFRFWGREKYIGCSKPSCYCCGLYFRYHPGNFVLRPAHNNVYVTWIPPLMSRLDEEPQRKHNLEVMNQMNAYIRRDVKEEIEERLPRRDRAPDSTSGVALHSFFSQ